MELTPRDTRFLWIAGVAVPLLLIGSVLVLGPALTTSGERYMPK